MANKKKFSNNWKKAKAKVGKLYQRISNIRKDFIHKVTADISKNHTVVFVEDLAVKNMCKSASKNVAQKSGLNRSILDSSPFEFRRQLEYKMAWSGGLLFAVPPRDTSRTCPECHHVSKDNRKSQAKFACVNCGFTANADWVAATNIKRQGIALLACLESSPRGASCQEPTEATLVQSCA